MTARIVPVLPAAAILVALLVIAGCGAAIAPSPSPIARAPGLTPVPLPTDPGRPAPTATTVPNRGGVDGEPGVPVLTIETVDADTIQATLEDTRARAWRLVVAGTGSLADDRWEILVETGDIAPLISATEVRGGEVVDVLDLTGFGSGTAAAGGCHPTLGVCLDSDGFSLPADDDGTWSVRLDLAEAGVPLLVRGGTAGWPGEPFILGPWTDTEAFPWGG